MYGIYENKEKYAETLNMSLEMAEKRLEYFKKIQDKMKKSKVCPTCQQETLEVEGGEWESGVRDWVYCTNNNVEKVDEDGEGYLTECDFKDDVEEKYFFAFDHDFDVVLMTAQGIDVRNEEDVKKHLGASWEQFVKRDTEDMMTF